jgi:Glycosyl transferase family 2
MNFARIRRNLRQIAAVSAADDGAMAQPLLSIAIPTYNRAPFLAQLLAHLLPQIKGRLEDKVEVLVVDNHSTDGTVTVMSQVLGPCPFVKFHRHRTNIGMAANFAFAVAQATGTFCWLVGDDDLILGGAVDKVLAQIQRGEPDFLLLNRAVGNHDLSIVMLERQLLIDQDRDYDGLVALARDFGVITNVGFITSVVFRRERYARLDPQAYHEMRSLYPQIGLFYEAFWNAKCRAVADVLVCQRQFNQRREGGAAEITLTVRGISLGIFELFLHLHERGIIPFAEIELIQEERLTSTPGQRVPVETCAEFCFAQAFKAADQGGLTAADAALLERLIPLFALPANRQRAEQLRARLVGLAVRPPNG